MIKDVKKTFVRKWLMPGLLGSLLPVVLCFAGCTYQRQRIKPPASKPIIKVMEVTAYCNCGTCCNWEYPWYSLFGLFGSPVIASGPNKGKPKIIGQTASGKQAAYGTVAADASFPFGTVLFIPGYGYGRVEDRGGAIKGDRLDVWFPTHTLAKQWGRRTVTVKIWKR
jgi:3D (Asp-Asp-Asp) domain-containing protein